uniref:DNA-directed RNA polymerase n=1 Tax=Plocamium cartilagineum TaxID=31452 RepID=A0A1C9CHN3_PLOCA|nr:RNA polymerase beta'' subunit [Plocamium cartilagineum]AOM67875.1 RNA polymerase beta'' subunit [Plocamium cartilagineum]
MKKNFSEPHFSNKVIDKSQLKKLIVYAFRNYGIARAANMADKLKDLGFYYATKAGISLSLEDLRIPPTKKSLLINTLDSITCTDNRYKRGEITAVERFQKVIDTWNNASESLKKQVVLYFKNTDPLNTIYMMAFSGARANISQVRQLVGMRGLMSDPQGQIIDLPIASNFREGLTITDYFISSYGARKGLVDTALRTADSGYLTRRLVDVAQDVIIRESDCKTERGIVLEEMIDNQKVLITLRQSLLGRVLAENILDPFSYEVIAFAGQGIDPVLADKIVQMDVRSVLVRSPITCNSFRSVCQLCYGWNLAHGRMVDLGEAVGIIAAQSIGEPGTQLTMRTFHTGGVFTGELAQTLTSPINCRVEYGHDILLSNARNRHGESAMLVNADNKLVLIGANNIKKIISVIKGTLLLVKNKSFVQEGSILAEYPISNRIITERAQKAVVSDFSGSIYLAGLTTAETEDPQKTFRGVKKGGIIWILSGKVYNIPDKTQLMISNHQLINENSLLACTKVISRYNGRVDLIKKNNKSLGQQIKIITSSKTFTNIYVLLDFHEGYKNYTLLTEKKEKFILQISPNQKIINNQIIGNLISNIYKTQTGGIIKYLDLSLSKRKTDQSKDYYEILSSGYILWISEETHEINKDISLLLVEHGEFVEAGTEIIKNVFSNNSGILEVVHKDGIIREIIIKPGKIYPLKKQSINKRLNKHRGFLRPGEEIINEISTDKLVYWEYIQIKEDFFILIRPVIVYSIPNKNIEFKYSHDSFETDIFNLYLSRRTYFRDGERIKSVYGINLVKTHLIAKIKDEAINLKCSMDLTKYLSSKSSFLLKFTTSEIVSIRDIGISNSKEIYTKTSILVNNNQDIKNGSILAKTEIFSSITGKISYIQDPESSNRRILIIGKSDIRTFIINKNQAINVKIHDWVYAGDEIIKGIKINNSGRIIDIQDHKIIMRIGQPYLISEGSFLHVKNNSLVQRGESIATLIFERAKTGDIIQGLPRIEEILEARKKSDESLNPHVILEFKFRLYLSKGLSLYDATRLSLLEIQLSLIKEVQLVYQSQGVDISDKHIEVIVRQMTSKVKIENGGDTEYLPGEMIELQKIESVNKSLLVMNKNQASYHPILLGITKASLNTESFISAASFQETTKVLTEAAISGKLDWLRGLKENVIIGRLIPAGTGFNVYSNPLIKEDNLSLSDKSSFEDIILDDRNARNYPLNIQSNSQDL